MRVYNFLADEGICGYYRANESENETIISGKNYD